MFECAGLKIAMENAEEYLKEKADYITSNNNDNGVAKAINKFIFDE
ncbi:MAG: HAD hydrolase family protein [Clostridia bacterium]|nr:HAD hydrolase family protein [Clostridia bacterium]MCI9274873.1 HAD hydrolase family protein [Clostridia bacterium]